MASKPRNRTAWRTLIALGVVIAAIFGGLGAASIWGNPKADWTPELGLDLAGGRQIIIEPRATDGGSISGEAVDQAIDIIRNRVDSQGVSEAEVSAMGSTNIAVSIPGNPTAAQMESLSRSSQLQFRPVLQAMPAVPTNRSIPLPEGFEPPEAPAPDQEIPTDAPDDATDGPTEAPSEGVYPGTSQASSVVAGPTDAPDEDVVPIDAPVDGDAPPADMTDEELEELLEQLQQDGGMDPSQISPESIAGQPSPEQQEAFASLDCFNPDVADAASAAPADDFLVVCSTDRNEKYILGPVELDGSTISDANAGLEPSPGGGTTGRVQVALSLNSEGGEAFAEITRRLATEGAATGNNRFAMVLDGEVISAPSVDNPIPGGNASITGNFTMEEAEELANQLRFGALPMSFDIQTSEQVSPTLGGEQLRMGLVAGAIGMLLVFAFMLVQYRALGLVTVATLLVGALVTYGVVTFLGWAQNMRLTMAGITGLILAIAIIADSFIVYFERIKDEVRAGRPLRYAVDTGWSRARRTILISDAVNLVVAGVLYFLSESSVAAFAFALGLITLIDILVVFMFTHPVVSILANTKFFGEGHQWSGFSPERLGAKRSAYLGRGQFRAPEPVGKPRHSREELEGGIV